ncbi:MAG: HYR domain-containing protein, partial [Saprospiraceae bacterium]
MQTERKHMELVRSISPPSPKAYFSSSHTKILLVLLWLLLMGSISHSLKAQTTNTCTLACSDMIEVPLGANCETRITPGLVYTDGGAQCPGDKNIILRDENNNIIAQGVNEIIIDLSAYVDMDIFATVVDQASGVFCTTIMQIRDNEPPKLNCEDKLLTCLGDTSVEAIGMPDISDNCDASLTLTHSDVIMSQSDDCDEGVLVLTRTWDLVDGSQNMASCTQNIVLERPQLADVDFPKDTILSCDNPDTAIENTGFPTIGDERIETGDICGLIVTFQDDTTFTNAGNTEQIIREWSVIRRCDGAQQIEDQLISIKDSEKPTIECPADFTVSTSVGECTAVLRLPSPTVTDNCDADVTFFVESSFGRDGLGPFGDIPVGQYSIKYTAIDGSFNQESCFTTLTVEDNESPNAICDDQVIVSLVEGGIAIARAITFDEGSRDNCAPQIYFKAKRLDTDGCIGLNGDDSFTLDGIQEWYDDFIFFCCEDLDVASVPVSLRVFTVNPGDGGIDPTRMAPGGDLFGRFNDCDGIVTVQDKIKPRLTCPEPVTIDCRESIRDLSVFGSPIVNEACMATLDSLDVRELDECGTGSIFRTFTAT